MAWDKGEPAAKIAAKLIDNRIRTNNSALETALNREHEFSTGGTVTDQAHHRQGSARCFFQALAPATRVDGTAFTSEDNGSVWIDSDDNAVYILTDYTGPTWTAVSAEIIADLLAAARVFAFADCSLTLQNTDEEDTDGGRQSRLIFKGEQSGGEVTTLGYLEYSHDGSSDDQKGQIKLVVNDGDDGNSPSKVGILINSDGTVVFAQAVTLADSSQMATDAAPTADVGISNKKYVDDSLALSDKTTADEDSDSLTSGTVYTATADGTVDVAASLSGTDLDVQLETPSGTMVQRGRSFSTGSAGHHVPLHTHVKSGDTFRITVNAGSPSLTINWQNRGTQSKPTK